MKTKSYVVSGYLDGWIPTNSLLIYDLETDAWSKGQDMPTPRGALTAQFAGGKMYAMGEYNETSLAKNGVYDPATNSWEFKSSLPTPREHLASTVLDDKLYAMGGRTGQSNLHADEMYDYQSGTWTVLEPLPTTRSGLTASVLGGAVFVFGVEGLLGTFEENEAYVPGEGWIEQTPMPISRHGLASSTVGDAIYLIDSGVAPGSRYSAITEKYHNAAIPEFGVAALFVMVISIVAVIMLSKSRLTAVRQ